MKKILLGISAVMLLVLNVAVPLYAEDETIQWTEDETAFMQEHPVIKMGVDPAFVPFEFIDTDGQYKGITADYLALLSQKTGLEFIVTPDLTWPEAYDKAIDGEIDLLPAVSKTNQRMQYFIFSKSYYDFERVIITKDTNHSIDGIEDLSGLTVAVQKNSSHHSYLLAFSDIKLSLYNSVEDALTAVANGQEMAFVGNLATTNYLIKENGLTDLKYIAFDSTENSSLYFAARKDWPQLINIINKALDTITKEEKITINNKWIGLETETDYGPIIQVILMVSAVIALVMGISAFWIIRLRKEIKKRKKVQQDLEKAKIEAEEANSVKSSFLARMSHEIRTPLNAITGMAYLLKKTQVNLTQNMYIDRITQASYTMLSIINDILDFSKIEAGKVELEIVSFSLDQVIQNVVNIASYKIEEQGISFLLTRESQMPNWYYGDAKRIEQILLNIISNAAKFTSAGEVSLDIRMKSMEESRCSLVFTIKDTGIGMSEKQVKQLFEPFAQGDASINRRFGGTGLGLSIVKNLLDMMHGDIQVFSKENEGSSFAIHLPLEVDLFKEEEARNLLSADYLNSVKTLVLERTGQSINIISSYLNAFGLNCELTTSEVSAVNMLEAANRESETPFDLLIIDYETPTEGGYRYFDSIRQNEKIIKKPKTIMLFPMMRRDLFDRLDDYGVDIGIGKPIIPSILFNGIIEIFNDKATVEKSEPKNDEAAPALSTDVPYTVLVVEDNKTNQLIAISLLQNAGITAMVASDGMKGVSAFTEHSHEIDAILMDLHMPVMSGYEAAVEIRKLSQNVPIIAMTADVIKGVQEKCESCGIYHYISKPFDPDRFSSTIRKIIEQSCNNKEQLPVILDQIKGLHNIGNNQQLYNMVLKEYCDENKDTEELLSLAINEKRFTDAIGIVHKIKSSTKSIGADPLYDVAVKLQKALENGNEVEIMSLYTIFVDYLKILLQLIRKMN